MSGGGALVLDFDTLISTDSGIKPVAELIGSPFTTRGQSGQPVTFAGFEVAGEQDTVNVRTSRGYKLTASADMVHHLIQTNGQPIIYSPSEASSAESGMRPQPWWDGFLTGLVAFSGFYSADPNRPARVIVPGFETAASRMLIRRLYQLREMNTAGGQWKIMKDDEQRVAVISSRLIDRVVEKYLEPRTLKPTFDLKTCNIEFRHGFAAAAVSIGRMMRDGIRVEHRSRFVIDDFHEVLLMSFGVRASRAHQPFAADFVQTQGNRGADGAILHRMTIEPDQFPILKARRLAKRDDLGDEAALLYLDDINAYADPIAEIVPGDVRPCAQLLGNDEPAILSANGFLCWSTLP